MTSTERGAWLLESPGALLTLFRDRSVQLTRTDLVQRTGLSRSAVNQRVDLLLRSGFLETSEHEVSTGGRPAERFRIRASRGVVLVADSGATGMRIAVADMGTRLLAERHQRIDITAGPEPVLEVIAQGMGELLAEAGRRREDVLAVGLDLPGPVDHRTRRVVNPPIMTGWHDYDVPAFLRRSYDCPVVVEKDVNAMAFGEHRLRYPEVDNLVFAKLGTGFGTGMVINGEIFRGSDGAAGDIGHIPLTVEQGPGTPVCRCGNLGCVEAYASGWALVRDLRDLGHDVHSVEDVAAALLARKPDAVRLMRQAALIVGQAVSDLVNIVNPRVGDA